MNFNGNLQPAQKQSVESPIFNPIRLILTAGAVVVSSFDAGGSFANSRLLETLAPNIAARSRTLDGFFDEMASSAILWTLISVQQYEHTSITFTATNLEQQSDCCLVPSVRGKKKIISE